jgi:hypothetical protein
VRSCGTQWDQHLGDVGEDRVEHGGRGGWWRQQVGVKLGGFQNSIQTCPESFWNTTVQMLVGHAHRCFRRGHHQEKEFSVWSMHYIHKVLIVERLFSAKVQQDLIVKSKHISVTCNSVSEFSYQVSEMRASPDVFQIAYSISILG